MRLSRVCCVSTRDELHKKSVCQNSSCQGDSPEIPQRLLRGQEERPGPECLLKDRSVRGVPFEEVPRKFAAHIYTQGNVSRYASNRNVTVDRSVGGARREAGDGPEDVRSLLDLRDVERYPFAVHEGAQHRGVRVLAGVFVFLGQDREV